jgi:hypothetical protein
MLFQKGIATRAGATHLNARRARSFHPLAHGARGPEPEVAMIKKKGLPGDDEFDVIPDDEAEDYDEEDGDDDLLDDEEELDDEFDDDDDEFDDDLEDDAYSEDDDEDFGEFEETDEGES